MPAQPLGWFKNEITDAAQLNGLKYRTVGLAADLFQAMGVSVTQLPGGEIVPAMDRGVIDAFEFNNPTSDSRFGAQDVAKNYMLGSYHQASESFEFMFNKDRFDSLDPDLQAILEHGVEATSTGNLALAMRPVFDRPAEAVRRRHQRQAHAGVDPAGAARGLGQDHPDARGGRLHQEGARQPAGLGRARRLLSDHERAELPARLRALLPGQDSGLIASD